MRSAGSISCGADLATYRHNACTGLATMSPLVRERIYPYLIAALLSASWWFAGKPFPRNPDALLGAAVTVASVFGAFLLASKAVLISLKDSEIFTKLRDTGYMNVFIACLKEGINASVVLVIISMLGFFFEPNKTPPLLVEAFYLTWMFAGLTSLLTYWRVSNLLFKMLKHA
jgi:hypothetical protein